MPATEDPRRDLDQLGRRIEAAREAGRPKRSRAEGEAHGVSVALRMVTELVTGIAIGALMGYGIDRLAGTLPLFLVVFGLFGFAAGVKVMLRTVDEIARRADRARAEAAASGRAGDATSGGKRG